MVKHADLIRPKFEIAYSVLERLSDQFGAEYEIFRSSKGMWLPRIIQ